MNNSFTVTLQKWYIRHKRPLPWRDTSNPYNIWLSEIILQQTRVNQGLPYYQKFIEKYPTVHHLAKSSEDEVLQHWQGLGYYSRGRNLLKCAKEIVRKHDGCFPTNMKEMKQLPGIGDYTASAILSFAFNQTHAVLDGNVYRVLSRYFGIDTPIQTPQAHKLFKQVASEILDTSNPAQHNQAIMEFGALQCTPKNPNCVSCVFVDSCIAARHNQVDVLPVKAKAKRKKIRYLNYIVFAAQGKTLIRKRPAGDIWQGLYEFPLIEATKSLSKSQMLKHAHSLFKCDLPQIEKVDSRKHLLTHQTIYADFWVVDCKDFTFNGNSDTFEVHLQALGTDYAMPILLVKFLASVQHNALCL